jgi:hypothetical protein
VRMIAAAILAAAVIEITGLPATVILLVPFIALALVVAWLRRPRVTARPPERPAGILRAIPDADALAPEPASSAPEPVPVSAPPIDWTARIRDAEATKDHAALAGFHLWYARAEIAAGRPEPAAEHLRSSLRAAAKSKNAAVQAEARLELAELARSAGDLTTACEHWQIARSLFHGLSDTARLGATERLMREHRCPTDWVLNDF